MPELTIEFLLGQGTVHCSLFGNDLVRVLIETLTLRERYRGSTSKFETADFGMGTFPDFSDIRRVDRMASSGIIPEPILTLSRVESISDIVHVQSAPAIVVIR